MKRLLCVICLTLLTVFLLASTASATAGTNTYILDALSMEISIPEDLVVFTRDIAVDDPNLAYFGLDRDALLEQYASTNIYLNALDKDVAYEVVVTMVTDSGLQFINDYNAFSDAELLSMASQLGEGYAAQGITYIDSEISKPDHPQVKFIKISIEQPFQDQTIYGLQYNTVINGNAINITLHSYSGDITDSMKAVLASIVASTTFTVEGAVTPTPFIATQEETNYYNADAGVGFTVPPGWAEQDLLTEGNHIRVKYGDIDGNSIMFGFTDMWNAMPEGEKAGYKRRDINNDVFTTADMKTMYETDERTVTNVSYETINSIAYFRIENEMHAEAAGIKINIPSTSYVLFYDGIMYEFLFGDAISSAAAYESFMETMASVQYDDLSEYSSTENMFKGIFGLPANSSTAVLIVTIIISIIITIGIYTVPIVIYRYAIKKERIPAGKAKKITIIYGVAAFLIFLVIGFYAGNPSPGGAVFFWSFVNYRILTGGKQKWTVTPAPPVVSNLESSQAIPEPALHNEINAQETIICGSCGNALPGDSIFCDQCGTKIPEDVEV